MFLTRNQRKILDDTLPIRYSGLSNNAHLELVTSQKSKKGKKISTNKLSVSLYVCVLPHVVTLLQLKPIIIENSYFFPPFCDESSLFANQVEEKFEMHFWKFCWVCWRPRIMILALLCRLFCYKKYDFITDKNINGYPVILCVVHINKV